jgi:hypothetical protein
MLCSRNLFLIVVFTPVLALGHTDISETIKALTKRIETKPTADLYYQRATEFRALQEKGPRHRGSRIGSQDRTTQPPRSRCSYPTLRD